MHEISPQQVQAAEQHMDMALQHGQQVEQLGLLLQKQDPRAQETGQCLEVWGQQIQQLSQEAKALLQEGQTCSREKYCQVLKIHGQAAVLHIQAVWEYTRIQAARVSPLQGQLRWVAGDLRPELDRMG